LRLRTARSALTLAGVSGQVSRAPLVVLAAGMVLALVLVLWGARLAAAPAPLPDLSRPGTPDQPRVVNVIMRDYVFNPSTLHLVAGETVRFNVINGGLVAHEFVLGDHATQAAWAAAHARATPPAAFASPPTASVPPGTGGLRVLLGPGESATLDHVVAAEVDLQLACHIPGHVERGMVGRVEVLRGTAPADLQGLRR
jgi:uncharacterized cupredoxin-like copper-binding protein